VKILAISDVIDDLVQSPNIAQRFGDVDLVLSCGDLPFEYLEYVVTMLGKDLYYVYGNHARHRRLTSDGNMEWVEPGGCINIHRRVVKHRGLLIAGLEGSLRYSPGEHQYTQSQMALFVRAMAPRLRWNSLRHGRAVDILITHAPPFGIHDDQDRCHQGFRSFLSFMDRYQPRYLIHGHTHLYRRDVRRRTTYGNTVVINAYGFQVIDIDHEAADEKRPSDSLLAHGPGAGSDST